MGGSIVTIRRAGGGEGEKEGEGGGVREREGEGKEVRGEERGEEKD